MESDFHIKNFGITNFNMTDFIFILTMILGFYQYIFGVINIL